MAEPWTAYGAFFSWTVPHWYTVGIQVIFQLYYSYSLYGLCGRTLDSLWCFFSWTVPRWYAVGIQMTFQLIINNCRGRALFILYRISGNFRENLIFAIFASDLKTRKYVSAKNCTWNESLKVVTGLIVCCIPCLNLKSGYKSRNNFVQIILYIYKQTL